jgi:hypothetical protein
VNAQGTGVVRDVKTSLEVIDKFATIPNAHFDNHDLNAEMPTKLFPMQIESGILKHYPKVHNQFQMYWMTDDVAPSIPLAISLKAQEVELWWDTIKDYSLSQLQTWSDQLKNNK